MEVHRQGILLPNFCNVSKSPSCVQDFCFCYLRFIPSLSLLGCCHGICRVESSPLEVRQGKDQHKRVQKQR